MAIDVILAGDSSSAIKELYDLSIVASVERGSVSSRITTEQLTFVNEYAELIRRYFEGGANGTSKGIYEGLPVQIFENGQEVFDGYLDFLNDFKIVDPTTVTARIIKHESYNDIYAKASGLTVGSLYEQGFITANDFVNVPYIIEKEFNFIEFAFLTYSIYSITSQLQKIISDLSKQIADLVMHATGGATGPAAVIIGTAALIAIDIAFSLFMVIQLVKLVVQLFRYLISPVKYHKAMKLDVLLQKCANYLGYSYNTSIPDVGLITLLPSKTTIDQDTQQNKLSLGLNIVQPGFGFPSAADYGYTFAELLQLVNDFGEAEFTFKNGVIQQHTINSAYWTSQLSTWQMPEVLDESITVNANELISDRLITFLTDPKDINTLINFKGTTYEIQTRPITVTDQRNILMKGFNKTVIPFALGTRKDKLNNFEKIVRDLLQIVDNTINFFGGNSNQAGAIAGRVGKLKLQTDYINIPKLLKLDSNGNLPSNHRDLWSAKYIYNTYKHESSFVLNNFGGQYQTKQEIRVPFGFSDFNLLVNNSYFSDSDGNQCKLELIDWEEEKDAALLNYRFKYKFTENLKETYIEQE